MSPDPEPTERTTTAAHAPGARAGALRGVPVRVFAAGTLLCAGLWALDRWVLHLSVLTSFRGTRAASPLYAFWNPSLRPEALAFVALAALFAWRAPRLADPARTGRPAFVAGLVLAGLALPLALFLVRQGLGELGAPFRVYANEEFWDDALKIPLMRDAQGRSGALVFLRHYVEAMPRLSLHGQHFPPGHALFLHACASAFGASLAAAALCVLAAAALGLAAAYFALRELCDEHAARQGALLLAALPPFLDFACTSMDAVFFLWAALALWASLRALRADARPGAAALAGAALALAAVSSFAALPLGLALALHAALLGARRERAWSVLARQLALIGAGFALGLVVLWLLTGFAWWDCVLHARASGVALMTRVLKGPPSSRWAELSYGNGAAYLIGAGAGVVALLLARVRAGRAGAAPSGPALLHDAWTPAAFATLAVMTVGGLFFMETERIWLFTLPWIAAASLAPGPVRAAPLRAALALALLQALVLEVLFFTLW